MSSNGPPRNYCGALEVRHVLNGQNGGSTLKFCEHCVFEKQKRIKFTKGFHNTKGTLNYIHFDLWGPSRVFFLKKKSDVLATFKEWKIMVEKQTRKQVKHLHTGNGLEFCSDEFNAL
ncbi:hypothetical protein CK203_052271 [Vitis vinifera]|uniref:Integrase catalytic domain-containing protein n=1 Tax=Vitis vinifera TaxID=29760 RepID=A0A438FWF6_VITVI|nr:hypothetical protein CK203_052271 [Vitis vinifera]